MTHPIQQILIQQIIILQVIRRQIIPVIQLKKMTVKYLRHVAQCQILIFKTI